MSSGEDLKAPLATQNKANQPQAFVPFMRNVQPVSKPPTNSTRNEAAGRGLRGMAEMFQRRGKINPPVAMSSVMNARDECEKCKVMYCTSQCFNNTAHLGHAGLLDY